MIEVVFERRVGEPDPPGQPMTRVLLMSDGSLVIKTGEEASSGRLDPSDTRRLMLNMFHTLLHLRDGTDRAPAEQVEPMNVDSKVSPIFQGLHAERYATNPAELDAALLWEAENTQATSLGREVGTMLNVWTQSLSLLGRLLSRDPDRGINPSPRDWLVASTVVQWLGTLRGRTFLAQLQVASSLRQEE